MGHIRLGELSRTRQWAEVVALLEGGAHARQVANASIRAAEQGLRRAPRDQGVLQAVELLMRLPHAARAPDFADALNRCGVRVPGPPTLMELVGAVADALDARLDNNRGRTDLGEMAQMATAEALAGLLGERTNLLYEAGADDVRRALGGLATVAGFGAFSRRYFARLTFKVLDYFLSRVLSDLVGEGARFTTLARQAEFSEALETHCGEAAAIVQRFAGEWLSKEHWERGEVPPRRRRALHRRRDGQVYRRVAGGGQGPWRLSTPSSVGRPPPARPSRAGPPSASGCGGQALTSTSPTTRSAARCWGPSPAPSST
jgi:hypothetical protein